VYILAEKRILEGGMKKIKDSTEKNLRISRFSLILVMELKMRRLFLVFISSWK